MFPATATDFLVGSNASQKIPLHHSIECRGIFFILAAGSGTQAGKSGTTIREKKKSCDEINRLSRVD